MKFKNKLLINTILIVFITVFMLMSSILGITILTKNFQKNGNTIELDKNKLIDDIRDEDIKLSEDIYEYVYENNVKNEIQKCNYNTINYNENIEVIYDLEGFPTFLLVQYENSGYFILDRITNTILERSADFSSPYYNLGQSKKYYAGYGEYFYENDNNILRVENDEILSKESKEPFINQTNALLSRNMNDGDSSATKESRWGKNDHYITNHSYFENIAGSNSLVYCNNDFCFVSYDQTYESNVKSSCGIVALEMIMQYYSRMSIKKAIPQSFVNSVKTINSAFGAREFTMNDINDNSSHDYIFDRNKSDYLSNHLHHYLDEITPHGLHGQNLVGDLKKGLESFYTNYPTSERIYGETHAFSNGIVDSINNNNPAILETGLTGNGYFYADNSWYKTSVSTHQMVVYGYCTNDSGSSLKELIVNGGWSSRYNKMYVHKNNATGNMTF